MSQKKTFKLKKKKFTKKFFFILSDFLNIKKIRSSASSPVVATGKKKKKFFFFFFFLVFDFFNFTISTIRWVLQGLLELGLNRFPPLGVLPLGTGNDLAREFGWGGGYNGEPLQPTLKKFLKCGMRNMDM